MTASIFVEREDQCAEIEALTVEAAAGSGRLVAIEGPAGIGKTRLVAAVRENAEGQGLRVLSARAGELERDFPFGVVRQLLEPVVFAAAEDERQRLFSGAAELADPIFTPAGGADDNDADPESGFARLHGLYWLLAAIAQSNPVALIVDDAHWADAASLQFLAYLVRRLDALPLFLLISARPAEPDAPRELDVVRADPEAHRIRLVPLSQAGSSSLLRASIEDADDPLCSLCHRVTGGNPFLLSELAAEMAQGGSRWESLDTFGPALATGVITARLARISADAARLARAVAILGDAVEPAIAVALAELDSREGEQAVRALLGAGILAQEGDRLSFVHPIVRTTVYADMSPLRRSELHGRAALALTAAGASPGELAAQLLHTEPAASADVVETLCEAAEEARRLGAPSSAARYLKRALAEPPAGDEARDQIVLELARALALLGDEAAVDSFRELIARAEDPAARARLALELGGLLFVWVRAGEAVDLLADAAGDLGEDEAELKELLEAMLLCAAVNTIQAGELIGDSVGRAQDRVAGLGDSPSATDCALLAVVALVGAGRGMPADQVAALALRALEGDALEPDGGPAFMIAAATLVIADRPQPSREAFEAMISGAQQRGSALGFAIGSTFRALPLLRLGLLREAEEDAGKGLELALASGAERSPMAFVVASALAWLTLALIEQGRLDEAEAVLESTPLDERHRRIPIYSLVMLYRARLLIERGELEAGVEACLACGRREQQRGWDNPSSTPWRSTAAIALGQLGETERARGLAEEELALAKAFGAPMPIGRALRALALVEGADTKLLTEAGELLRESPTRLEEARALVDLGAALRRDNQRSQARERLREGLTLAQRCGAAALARRAEDELLAAGSRKRGEGFRFSDELTPSEHRVALLAQAGKTNNQIAQELFVTTKTVEMHLSRAYKKLEISSRQELSGLQLGER